MKWLPERYVDTGVSVKGGMGNVLICKDTVLERTVAVKIIQPAQHKRRMLDELAALQRLRSKHVVQVYDVLSLAKGEFALVLEYVDGKDLADRNSAPKSEDELLKVLWQVASGLADIHSVGVIHRDIKPNNMKIDPEGVIKIFDFGLARSEGGKASTMGFVGTPGFAAPELFGGLVEFTTAVDVFAFGATAYFIAAGSLPQSFVANPAKGIRAGFGGLNLKLASDIVFFLDACLAADPQQRPRIADVRDALAQHLLVDRHQALLVYQGKVAYLNAQNRVVKLSMPQVCSVGIAYDGLVFKVTAVEGDVFINNRNAEVGQILPGSCVVTLGGPEMKADRRYITFDVSHPEIVL